MLFGALPLFNSLPSKAFATSIIAFSFYLLLSVLLPSAFWSKNTPIKILLSASLYLAQGQGILT